MRAGDYRNLASGRTWFLSRSWAICRWNLRLILRRKLFWLLLSLGMMHFLFFFALIYTKAQIEVQNPSMARFMERFLVTGTGDAYRDFLNGQSQAVMILLAYAGVVLIGSDFHLGGLAFYLSRPISKTQYLLGKAMTLWVLICMLTLVPALILFAAYGLFSNSLDYWWDNPRIVVGIVGYSLVVMSTLSLLTMSIAAVCRRSASFVTVWIAIFLLLSVISELLRRVFDSPHWRLLNLWRSIRMLGDLCFGNVTFSGEWSHTHFAAAIVVAVSLVAWMILVRKVQPVEIVQ